MLAPLSRNHFNLSADLSSSLLSVNNPVGLSAAEIWIQQIVFFSLLAGVFSTCGNIAIAVGIVRTKKLRTRFFIILLHLVSIRALIGLQLLVIGIHRSLRTLQLIGDSLKKLYCYFIHFHTYYAMTLEMVLLLGLVVDRALAILAYAYYRTLTKRQAAGACALAIVCTVALKIAPSVWGVNFHVRILCLTGFSPISTHFEPYHRNIDLVLSSVILILYLSLLAYLHFRLTPVMAADRQGDKSAVIAFKRQIRLLPLLRRLVLLHLALALSTKILVSVAGFVPDAIGLRFTAYGSILNTVDLFSNVIMLLASNRDLREAAFPFCRPIKVPIESMATIMRRCPVEGGREGGGMVTTTTI